MSIQHQYTSALGRATETWVGVTDSVTDTMQKVFAQPTSPYASIDPHVTVDRMFDFWEQTLEVQRGVAKQFVGVTVAAAQGIRNQAGSVATVVRDLGDSASYVVREQAEATRPALVEQVAEKFGDLTKAQLQVELASRGLPKSGSVNELRSRLIEHDVY